MVVMGGNSKLGVVASTGGSTTEVVPDVASTGGSTTEVVPGVASTCGSTTEVVPGVASTGGSTTEVVPGIASTCGSTTEVVPGVASTGGSTTEAELPASLDTATGTGSGEEGTESPSSVCTLISGTATTDPTSITSLPSSDCDSPGVSAPWRVPLLSSAIVLNAFCSLLALACLAASLRPLDWCMLMVRWYLR